MLSLFFFSSRRRHTRCSRDWSSDVCSSDLVRVKSCVFKQFRPGEGTENAEALAKAVLHFCEQGIILIFTQWVVVFSHGTKQRIPKDKAAEIGGGGAADGPRDTLRTVRADQLIERIGDWHIPGLGVIGPPIGVKYWRSQRLPESERRVIL